MGHLLPQGTMGMVHLIHICPTIQQTNILLKQSLKFHPSLHQIGNFILPNLNPGTLFTQEEFYHYYHLIYCCMVIFLSTAAANLNICVCLFMSLDITRKHILECITYYSFTGAQVPSCLMGNTLLCNVRQGPG